jgi:ribonuclease R
MSKKKKQQKPDSSKDLRGRLLAWFKEHPGKSHAEMQIARKFSASFGRNDIIRTLYSMVAQGLLTLNDTNKFRLKEAYIPKAEHGQEYQGKLDMIKGGNAYVVLDGDGKDIYVQSRNLHRALDGDTVKVVITGKGRGRPEGVITEILERHRTTFIGIVDKKKHCFVKLDNQNIGVDFYIPDEEIGWAEDGDKVVVEMTHWPKSARNPYARITEVLGKAGNNDIEMKSLLVENGFFLHFSQEALEEAEALSNKISEDEIAKRKDFRTVTTFTIDPLDAKDFDDAISIRKLDNGHWEIGVHIADVSHYVPEGSALDRDAMKRATSVYLVDRVAPMFPEQLSNIVCSLRPKEEKCCFAAVFEMDEEARVIQRWFGRTVIYSDKRFVYEEAQEVIEGIAEGPFRAELLQLNGLAKKLRAQRFKEGSVNFDTREVRFKLDSDGKPIGVFVKERKDAHLLVEDFMLLANKHVAQFVGQEKNPSGKLPFVYRVHDQPDENKLMDFSLFAARFGYRLNLDNPKVIAKELNRMMEQLQGKPEQNLLEQLAIRTMAKAIYTTNNIGHYGLGFSYYTHFTSPIRRYPDVMVHRLLQRVLSNQSLPKADEIEQQCKHSSDRERAAMEAERASVKYKMIEFMEDRTGHVFRGVVSGIKSWGVYVELPEYNTEGMIRLDSFDDDKYVVDERRMEIRGIFSNKKYQMGDFIFVRLSGVDKIKKTIDFELASASDYERFQQGMEA